MLKNNHLYKIRIPLGSIFPNGTTQPAALLRKKHGSTGRRPCLRISIGIARIGIRSSHESPSYLPHPIFRRHRSRTEVWKLENTHVIFTVHLVEFPWIHLLFRPYFRPRNFPSHLKHRQMSPIDCHVMQCIHFILRMLAHPANPHSIELIRNMYIRYPHNVSNTQIVKFLSHNNPVIHIHPYNDVLWKPIAIYVIEVMELTNLIQISLS